MERPTAFNYTEYEKLKVENERLRIERDAAIALHKDCAEELNHMCKERDAAIKDLRIYGCCPVCHNCDDGKYPSPGYCKIGGCQGGGNGKIADNRWEWRGRSGENE